MSVFQVIPMPHQAMRYSRRAPAAMGTSGVRMRKLSHGGVMCARLFGFSKTRKASSMPTEVFMEQRSVKALRSAAIIAALFPDRGGSGNTEAAARLSRRGAGSGKRQIDTDQV